MLARHSSLVTRHWRIASRLTRIFKDLDWLGILAVAIAAQLTFFALPAQAGDGNAELARQLGRDMAELHELVQALSVGSMTMVERRCLSYAKLAGDAFDHRNTGGARDDLVAQVREDLSPETHKRVLAVIDEVWVWTDGRDEYVQHIIGECLAKRWPTELMVPAPAPESHSLAPSSPRACPAPRASLLSVKGQPMHCSQKAAYAAAMLDGTAGIRTAGFKPEHFNEPGQRAIAELAVACKDAQDLRECVIRRCMEQHT